MRCNFVVAHPNLLQTRFPERDFVTGPKTQITESIRKVKNRVTDFNSVTNGATPREILKLTFSLIMSTG